MLNKETLLRERFGHHAFKEGQEEAIDAIMNGRDLLMILPTGGGKSLAYQLPSLMMGGTTVVISPLIALMQDQVHALKAQQMQAAMLSHTQSTQENDAIIAKLMNNELSFLYLSPERLNTPKIQYLLGQIAINFFVIDEAHCISEWGHEFREDYRSLRLLKSLYPAVSIAAFTATATSQVQHDIISLLSLNEPFVFKGKIFRHNLLIQVRQRIKNGYDALIAFLQEHQGENGIVYVSSRKKSEELSAYLNTHGFSSLYYHAGMPQQERDATFEAFVYDRVSIVVATIAFGMGIDKSNIRFVVHMSMPKTLENYYQEIGRAGRDGDSADVLMLYSGEDMVYAKMRLEEIDNEQYRWHLQGKLTTMYRYVSGEACRHQFLAKYFEDTIKPCASSCDNCQAGEIEKQDITIEAQKLLSTVYKTGQRFGKSYVIDVLRGSTGQKILENGHDELSVYGIGKSMHKNQWLVIIDRLLETECLRLGEYQVIALTSKGGDVLRGTKKINIALSRLHVKKLKMKKEMIPEGDFDGALFSKLRELRASLSLELGIPAYLVFSDKSLKEMAKEKPVDEQGMLEINGVGKKKFEQYGEAFLKVISFYL